MFHRVLLVLIFSYSSYLHAFISECPDFSGVFEYKNQEGQAQLELLIKQEDCFKIELDRNYYEIGYRHSSKMYLDNEYYKERVLNYYFNRKHFWDESRVAFKGTYFNSDGRFIYNVKGYFELDADELVYVMSSFDEDWNHLNQVRETFYIK